MPIIKAIILNNSHKPIGIKEVLHLPGINLFVRAEPKEGKYILKYYKRIESWNEGA